MNRIAPNQLLATLVVGTIIGVAVTAPGGAGYVAQLAVLCFSLGMIVWTSWKKPSVALLLLVVLLPFQELILARLYLFGFSPEGLALGRLWKEFILATLVARWIWGRSRQHDNLDRLIVAFLIFVGVYLVLPLGPGFQARLLGARLDAAFLLVFLVARHLKTDEWLSNWLEQAILIAGAVVAVIGLWNSIAPGAFEQWVIATGISAYREAVLHVALPQIVQADLLNGVLVVRAGSIFLRPINLAYYLAIPIGIAAARFASGRAKPWQVAPAILCVAGLLSTLTRSAIIALPLVVVIALRGGRRFAIPTVAVVIAIVALWPLASRLGLEDQVRSGFDTSSPRTAGHVAGLQRSIQRLEAEPLGTGLGTANIIADRFGVPDFIVNESWYFLIGTEIGILPMLIYFWVVLLTLRMLWRRATTGDSWALAALCALFTVVAGGLVLHTLDELSISWTVWMLAGLALRDEKAVEGQQADALRSEDKVVRSTA